MGWWLGLGWRMAQELVTVPRPSKPGSAIDGARSMLAWHAIEGREDYSTLQGSAVCAVLARSTPNIALYIQALNPV